jgi:CubicO group peptidase (beta-lactamase class C family)
MTTHHNPDRRRLLAAAAAAAGALTLAPLATRARAICPAADAEGWSGVLLIADADGREVIARGATYPGGPPIRPETRFNILSLGKMITGVLVGQLIDAGQVRMDDRVGAHLPELPTRIGDLTVGMLLNHTSGLGDYIQRADFAAIDAAERAADLLPLVLRGEHTPPGRISYCNSGYAVAGALIERYSGMSYAGTAQRRIFGPAGMRSAGFEFRNGDAIAAGAGTARSAGDKAVQTLRGGPSGGAFMTAGDVARFARALLSHRLMRRETFELLTSISVVRDAAHTDGRRRGWGYGFGVTGDGPGRLLGHTGGLPGASAALRMQEGSQRIVVALANQDVVDAAFVSRQAWENTACG